jgi:hypothetical protein
LIEDIPTINDLVQRLVQEYVEAVAALRETLVFR